MPGEQPFGSSRERNCAAWQFWPALAVLMQILGFTLIFPQLAYGQQVEENRFLLANVRVIVGDGTVLESGALLIKGSRITAVGPRLEIEPHSSIEVIDLAGKTIMPALIDSHAHLGYQGHTSWGGRKLVSRKPHRSPSALCLLRILGG